ncbi:MAG: SIS domain-containing protein [Candidatus Promineifilaceae bacterium]|nr:SIS domain-containing protein [Candidatus Promineifilaceae bacterium]
MSETERVNEVKAGKEERASHARRYLKAIQTLQRRIIEDQSRLLEYVAARMVETIGRDGRLFIFGTGHSHLLAEEAFFRAGGLAPVVPIFSSALMLHENVELGSRLERSPDLAADLLERYRPQPDEMIFIFSNSGVNQLPVEMALRAKERGLFVVSVASLEYAQVAPLSPIGKRLDEVADVALDNGGRPGDALLSIEGFSWRVAPSSTIAGALIWNALVAETAALLQAAGREVPAFASLNMEGAAEHNEALLKKWRGQNPHL